MDLSNSIKKAAQQQPKNKPAKADHIKKGVNLGSGRTSNYGYNGVGRPTNEGCEGDLFDGTIINE